MAEIPEDLNALYSVACSYSTIDGRLMDKSDAKTYKCLIERIATAEERVKELEAQVQRLSAPISQYEAGAFDVLTRRVFKERLNLIISSRLNPPANRLKESDEKI